MKRRVCLILCAAFLAASALADGIRPVTVKVKEQESGKFLVQWRVPRQIPPRAIPSPVLPDSCRVAGGRSVIERPDAWFLRQAYLCPDGISGQAVGVDYPFLNVTVSTLLRVELLAGERQARLLSPGEDSWQLPQATSGGAPAWMRTARDGVRDGAIHFTSNGAHGLFMLSLLLLGGLGIAVRLVTVFTVGQLVAVAVVASSGVRLGTAAGEIGIAVAAALLAREALRPRAERKQLTLLAAAAGLVHGLGIAPEAGLLSRCTFVLGMDAVLLLGTTALWVLGKLASRMIPEHPARSLAAYAVAGLALALAVSAPVARSTTTADEKPGSLRLPGLSLPDGSAGPAGSRRVAARVPDAVLQSFVAVDAFEVRHEVLVRLVGVADLLGLDPSKDLAIEAQDEVRRRIRELVVSRSSIAIDGKAAEPVGHRVDFLTLDTQGALPRRSPVPEPVDVAWLGVTTTYLTAVTPRDVALSWEGLDEEQPIPATVTDPESSRSVELTAGQPVLRWENELAEDPAPVVTAIAVEPATVWMPVWSLLPLGGAVFFGWAALRGRHRELSLALVRVAVAGALLLGPVAGTAVALPLSAGSVPDPARARRILAGVLPNVYRAFESPTESAVYDRLELSVTGDTLREVYLEHRRAVTMEERGGARARVEAVEIVEVDGVDAGRTGGGFVADAAWTVGGTVTHFGHRHFRQNRYDALVEVVPVDGIWKIRSIELLEEQRLR